MMQKQSNTIYLKDYQVPDFKIDQVFLHFDLYDEETKVHTVLHLRRNPKSAQKNAPLRLYGEEITLSSIAVDGQVLVESEYQLDEKALEIAEVPDQFVLETTVVIRPQENKQLSGLYRSRNNFCTQCEPHGFRRITYFLDRPDVMSRFTTTITADRSKYPYLLSNGNLIETKELPSGRSWVRWQDPSLKPCYLFALVAGDFDLLTDTFTTQSGREVTLQLYVEKGFADQGHYALKSLQTAMRWDEEVWGREYDLDIYMIVAVSDFNMGAMENKGLNLFNTKYILAKPETATDQDYVNIELVIGHEYFHNWSGNRVTCRDWFQITLKEGLTVFRDQTFSIDCRSAAVARLPEINLMRVHQFAEDASPLAHSIRPDSYIEVNNFYTLTVYRKGAEVIRMVETLVSKSEFRKGLDLYFKRYDGQAVTTEDFIQAIEDASGKDLTQFKRWYSQVGTPILEVTSDYDEDKKTFTLTVEQIPEDPLLQLPLSIGLISPQCTELATQLVGEEAAVAGTRVLELTKKQHRFTFLHVEEKPILSLLRNFSAPVECRYAYTNEELAWLLQCDTDVFARWDAGQKLMTAIILEVVQQRQFQVPLQVSSLLLDAFKKILSSVSPKDDLNLISKLLLLPEESYLISQIDTGIKPDVETIHYAREFVKRTLGKQLRSLFLAVYEEYHTKAPYVFNVQAMGERSLKNVCLLYLAATESPECVELIVNQLATTDNMTDCMGALQALNNYAGPERAQVLQQFYQKWQSEPLVVNKWLSLQACSTLPDTLDQVRLLLKHPAFDIHNPNNVYALLVTFGHNQVRFHEASGSGYVFIADQVLAIDSNNPQVAARVLQPLTKWRQFDAERAEKMRAQLKRIAATPGISPDVFEISTKSK